MTDQMCAVRLVEKWWAEAIAQGVRDPEEWVAKQCAEEVRRAILLVKAGMEEERERGKL